MGISTFWGQQEDNKIELAKKEYITKELQLNTQESEAFFPLYNEYCQKRKEIRKIVHKELSTQNTDDAQNLTKIINGEQDLVNIQKEYSDKFKKIISEKKIIQLFEVERKFKKMLINRLND